jgi:hypothetical protein
MITPPKLTRGNPEAIAPRLEPGASFERATLTQVNWAQQTQRRLSLDDVTLVAPDLTSAKLRDGGWADVRMESGLLAGADLAGTSLRRVQLDHVRADGLILSDCEVKDVTISGAKLDLANFRFGQWVKVRFIGCSLRDVDFNGSQLGHVTFEDCELTGADFSGAKLHEVDLRSARFDSLGGMGGLRGAIMSYDQMIGLVPDMASELGIILK